jgi:hypothetical protein
MRKQRVLVVAAAMGVVMAGGLLSSCVSYGVGVGYASRSQTVKPAWGESVDLTNDNTSVLLYTSNDEGALHTEYLFGFGQGTVSAKDGRSIDAKSANIGAYLKIPFVINQFLTPSALVGGEYQWFTDEKVGYFWNQQRDYDTYIGDFAIKFGAGIDYFFSKSFFVMGRFYYAPPLFSERSEFTVNVGLGYRTDKHYGKKNWKTKDERTIEMVETQGQKALDDKDYSRAIDLYTQGIAIRKESYPYYYQRSKAHAGAGDYAAALDDFNQATRINPLLQGSEGYKTWKQLVADYEKASDGEAPMDDQGKLIVSSSLLKMVNRSDSSWKGSGNGVSYPAGPQTLTFWYENGSEKTGEAAFKLDIEAGHVYSANHTRDGFTVTITIEDVTERELRGGSGTTKIASKTVEIAVAALPSAFQLPSWVQEGMTKRQVRTRMGRAPDRDLNNKFVYGGGGVSYVFAFSESGGLSSYSIGAKAKLNAVLNSLRKIIGREPIKDKDSDGDDRYMWIVPFEIRDDILALYVMDIGDGDLMVNYFFIETDDD